MNNAIDFPYPNEDIFMKKVDISLETREKCLAVNACLEQLFQGRISCLLLQGSSMRGDEVLGKSDYDFVCIMPTITRHDVASFAIAKKLFPDCAFLFMTEEECRCYPPNLKWQMFLTRKISGDFDFGNFPSNDELHETLVQNAIRLKNVIRPLIIDFTNDPQNETILQIVHNTIKRTDDCFARVYCLSQTGKYPLRRADFRELAHSKSIDTITGVLDRWYLERVSPAEAVNALDIGSRLISIFLKRSNNKKPIKTTNE